MLALLGSAYYLFFFTGVLVNGVTAYKLSNCSKKFLICLHAINKNLCGVFHKIIFCLEKEVAFPALLFQVFLNLCLSTV